MPIYSNFTHSFMMKGVKLAATIPLYCFNRGDSLDAVDVKDESGAWVRIPIRINHETASDADVVAVLEKLDLPVVVCPCGAPTIQEKSHYRSGKECEKCEMKKINAEYEKAQKKEDAKQAKKEAKLFKDGYRFKLVAWIHAGGDDRQLVSYSAARPTETEVHAILKRYRSKVLNDYAITELKGELVAA